jgi:hypothetical protein
MRWKRNRGRSPSLVSVRPHVPWFGPRRRRQRENRHLERRTPNVLRFGFGLQRDPLENAQKLSCSKCTSFVSTSRTPWLRIVCIGMESVRLQPLSGRERYSSKPARKESVVCGRTLTAGFDRMVSRLSVALFRKCDAHARKLIQAFSHLRLRRLCSHAERLSADILNSAGCWPVSGPHSACG